MRSVWVLAVIACGGCFSKPPFSGHDPSDANDDGSGPDAPPCTAAFTITTASIAEVSGDATGEPAITKNGLELYWVLQTGSNWDIRWAQRASDQEVFTESGSPPPFALQASIDQDPSFTSDGDLVIFRAGSATNSFVRQVRRSNGATWDSTFLDINNLGEVTSLDVSADGLTLYYTVLTDLHYATRSDRSSAFVPGGTIGQMMLFPSISADQKTLYFMDQSASNQIGIATRGALGSAFTRVAAPAFALTHNDPDVSADDNMLVLGNKMGGIAIAERTCP